MRERRRVLLRHLLQIVIGRLGFNFKPIVAATGRIQVRIYI
jgi:hypothetical protein